ncbi:hypothetical protein EJD97_015976 [Solanum chilense]|uniref:Embryo surrounding factor 1 brassicaceae domain-containing protein n=1 Tax=Solanum chilense TaxID=4083 RepID=A0A6N2BDS3_SOLCI|nr:hypothetical protein EJD97_015976 [Solanum chilense]
MSSFKVHFLLLSLLLINFSESRFAIQQHNTIKLSSYLKMFETLGMVCKCCDGDKFGQDLCSATWDGSCSNLKCFPWKSQ